jgi:ACS family tartrate transporter-like MFS transporter
VNAVAASPADLASAVAAARRRLIPFLFLLYIVAYVDRINVGFAALQMNRALGFSSTTFGLGAGIFFLGYVLFEIPGNIVLARVGARLWIARIMFTWGLISSAMMLVHSAETFYALRFLLGVAEAGFFPGVVFYLTRWFPARERARAFAAFMTAILMAGVIGGPVSGALLTLDGAAGLAGWQWVFLLEGLPAIALAFVVLFALPETPHAVSWLSIAERTALVAAVEEEQRGAPDPGIARALRQPRTLILAAVYFTIPVTTYGVGFWLPQMLKSASGAGDFGVGLLSVIPYAVGAVGMVVFGRHSDRTGERRWHVLTAALVSAAGLLLTPLGAGVVWTVLCLSIAILGYAAMLGPFWALTTASMRGVGAAAAIALVNSIGNTGGFVGPFLLGAVNDATHSFAVGLAMIAAMLVLGASLVLFVRET